MGSSHFGEVGLGSSSNGSSSSSRKGKKGSSSGDKPKQPQRGLGVAQLEKIRLHNQMASNTYPPSLHHHQHHHPFHTNIHKEDDMRIEMGFSSSPSSSSYTATSSPIFSLHPNTMMGFEDVDQRPGIRYAQEFQSSCTSRSLRGQQNVTLPLLEQNMEDEAQKKRRQDRRHSMGSMSQYSDPHDSQEIDLDLKLSL